MSFELVMHGDTVFGVNALDVCLEHYLPSGEAHWFSFSPGVLYCGQRAYDALKATPRPSGLG